MGGSFTAVLEVKEDAGWKPSAPIALEGGDGDSAREVGIDFLAERQPRGEFRLRVWPGRRADLLSEPAVTVGPKDVRGAERGSVHVLRAGRRHHRVRMSGPASEVVGRVRLGEVEPGMAIMVTDDPHNTAASECDGPWYPASDPVRAVRATVKQRRALMGAGDTVRRVDFVLSVGEMRGVRPDRTVVPA